MIGFHLGWGGAVGNPATVRVVVKNWAQVCHSLYCSRMGNIYLHCNRMGKTVESYSLVILKRMITLDNLPEPLDEQAFISFLDCLQPKRAQLLKCDLCHMTCDSLSPSFLCFLLLSFSLTHSLLPSLIT